MSLSGALADTLFVMTLPRPPLKTNCGLFFFFQKLTLTRHSEKVLARNSELQQQNKDFVTSLDALASMEELEKVIYETIRIAQQSLTLRLVRKPMSFPLAVRAC